MTSNKAFKLSRAQQQRALEATLKVGDFPVAHRGVKISYIVCGTQCKIKEQIPSSNIKTSEGGERRGLKHGPL